MIVINTINTTTFELNSTNFNKIYQPLKQGTTHVGLYNIYDTRNQILSSTHFSDFNINGLTYNSQADVIDALLDVCYGVSSSGSGGSSDELTAHLNDYNNPHLVSKFHVGLGEVDNISDADKPISTATQSALDLKSDIVATGRKLSANQSSATISLLDINDNVLDTLSVGFLNNEGTTLVYNASGETIDITNDDDVVLSSIPTSSFLSNIADNLNLSGSNLQLRDSANNVLSTVQLTTSNIDGLVSIINDINTDISSNTSNISANFNAIATAESDIQTNTQDIGTLASQTASDISDLQTGQNTNTTNIINKVSKAGDTMTGQLIVGDNVKADSFSLSNTNFFNLKNYDGSNTVLSSIIAGTTSGTLLESFKGGHFVLGIRHNADSNDRFHIVSNAEGTAYNEGVDDYSVSVANFGYNSINLNTETNIDGNVSGDIYYAIDGGVTTPSYSFGSANNNCGMYSPQVDRLAFATDSLERLRINHIGNVGINQSTPTEKLDVDGNVKANSFISASDISSTSLPLDATNILSGSSVNYTVLNNRLIVNGFVNTETTASGYSLIGTLPTGARPSTTRYVVIVDNNGDARKLTILTNGEIKATLSSSEYLDIDFELTLSI